MTDAAVDHALNTNRLFPVFRGVFALGRPGIGSLGRGMAAVLACGDGSVISHGTAAALLGLRDRAPIVIDVISPGQAGRKIDGIRRHDVRRPAPGEAFSHEGIPCTTPARTLVDLAGILSRRSLRRAVERAAVLGLLDLPAIDKSMAGPRRGTPVLRAILADWRKIEPASDGQSRRRRLRSDLEAKLLALIGAGGLTPPLCNPEIEAEGNRYEVDLLWPEQRLVVEADGRRYHDDPAAFERDRQRDRALHLNGYRVLRFTWAQVEREPEAVTSAIRRLLTGESR